MNNDTLTSRLHFKNQEIKTVHIKKKKKTLGQERTYLVFRTPQKVSMAVGGGLIKGRVVCSWVEEEDSDWVIQKHTS